MQMQGQCSIRASRAEVWRALNSPEVLKSSIPGCEEFERVSETSFEGRIVQKIGPVKARFTCLVELADIVEGESYTISGEGKGGAAGFAKGRARVRLEDAGDGTLLVYDAEAKVGGKLAQLGSRLIDGFARKMAEEFFTRFRQAVEAPEAPEAAEAAEAEAPEADVREAEASGEPEPAAEVPATKKKGWFRRLFG